MKEENGDYALDYRKLKVEVKRGWYIVGKSCGWGHSTGSVDQPVGECGS
jgi:hypothetical protein